MLVQYLWILHVDAGKRSIHSLMQAANSLTREALHKTRPIKLTSSLHEFMWQVDQPMSRTHVQLDCKSYEAYWSVRTRTSIHVYMRRICSSMKAIAYSQANVAIQDVAMVQQCLKTNTTTEEVKLMTRSALTFPLLNESSGKHLTHRIKLSSSLWHS